MTHVSATPARPSISACLIVRDEAANLRPCLESLGDLASEIIVVDTGSTDDTVEIARSLGASVHSFAWVDDFAAARNESLRHATGEWVFWLDADDRLSPRAVAQLKLAAASGRADAFICDVVSRHQDGSHDVTEHIRLFRNGLGISFAGALHESVFPSLMEKGLVAARTEISIEHTGYQSAEVVRAKSRRNLPILDREMALHPERLDLLFYRGHTIAILEEPERAAADLRRYLAGTRPSGDFDQLRFWVYADLARCMEKLGREQQMEELLRSALSEFREHPYFLAALGRVLLGKGKPGDAIKQLRAARDRLNARVRGFRPPATWIDLGLAEAHRALGQIDEAVRWAGKARAQAADASQATALLASLYLQLGRMPQEAQLRGLVLMGKGDDARAAGSFAEAISSTPSDPSNYRYLAAALRKLGREKEALEAWQIAEMWQAKQNGGSQAGMPSAREKA